MVTATQFWQTEQISKAEYEKEVSDDLIRHTLELELLLDGVIQHPNEKRGIEQWMAKHKSAGIFLSKTKVSAENKESFDHLHRLFIDLRQLYSDRNWRTKSAEVTGKSEYMQNERAFEQMLSTTHQLVMESLAYGKKTSQKLKAVRSAVNFMMLFLALGMTMLLGALSFFLGKRILYSINILKNGSETIGAGNLDYRLENLGKDEFGDLSDSFNAMTEKLQSITASRDELNREIVERKEAEKLLTQNQQYLRKVLDSQSNIIVINSAEHLIDANKAFFTFFSQYKSIDGFKKEHECICELFKHVDRPGFLTATMEGRSWIEILQSEQETLHKAMIRRKQEEHIFAVQLESILLNTGKHNIVTLTDITELENYQRTLEQKVKEELEKRRQKEAQILQQTKTVQMGEMITNITHHWRQPLNIIGLKVQELRDAQRYGELSEEYLSEVVAKTMEELTKMSNTLDKFRSFVVAGAKKSDFKIADAITKILELIQPALQSHFIELYTELDDSMRFYGSENTVLQVLYNILLNAQEAIVAAKVQERKIFVSLQKGDKERAVITIDDTAGGIDDTVMPRIFDPFFTTRGNANKTGTGLYFAKNMIELELGGQINAANTEKGARFTIALPTKDKEYAK